MTASVVGVEKLTPARMKSVLDGDGRVVVRVPDLGDPCGTKKVVREVEAAFDDGGGWWSLYFAENFHPLILKTTEEFAFERSDAQPATEADSGPCAGCLMVARMREQEAAEQADRARRAERERREKTAEVQEQGRHDGEVHARHVLAFQSCPDWAAELVPERIPPQHREWEDAYGWGWEAGVGVVLEEEGIEVPEREPEYDDFGDDWS